VWDGDQLLYEISAPGYTGAGAAQMEKDTGIVVHHDTSSTAYFPYGRVMYTRGLTLDRPPALYRMEYSDSFYAPQLVVLNFNWRRLVDNNVNKGIVNDP